MKNIYDLVGEFYATLEYPDSAIITKEITEKYFRTEIWRQVDEMILREQWDAIHALLRNISNWEYEDFYYVTPSDYQEIFYDYAKGNDLPLDESTLKKFFSLIQPFFRFYLKSERKNEVKFYEDTLREGKKSFYLYKKFSLPCRRPANEDFYIALEHDETISQKVSDKLNKMIDNLLLRIRQYFNQELYVNDLNRAFGVFYASTLKDNTSFLEHEKQRGFITFWEFFLFDYHTIKEDETPVYIFYKKERRGLLYAEDQILRDLMGTKLTIFYIEDQDEERAICRDLLTNRLFDLPPTPVDSEKISRMVFIGNIRAEGVMLLDHVIAYQASQNLRGRIKQEILRAFELFKYQKPRAKLQDFLDRESAMVRHIIRVLSEFAQLNVVPLKDFPKPIQSNNDKIPPEYKAGAKRLRMLGKNLGISEYGLHLLMKLYSDFLFIFPGDLKQKQSDASLLAVLYLFYRANDLPTKSLEVMTREVKPLRYFSLKLENLANSILKIETFDPRYTFEDGFVCMLFE